MKKLLNYGFTLGGICVIAAGLLAGAHSLTRPRILIQEQKEEEAALKAVFPEGDRFDSVKSEEGRNIYYKVYGQEGRFLGIAFKAFGKGYSSRIETIAAMDPQGAIKTIKILSHAETPGLGTRITEPSFISQFSGKNVRDLNIQAISGATISSKAVIDSVKKKAKELEGVIRDGK